MKHELLAPSSLPVKSQFFLPKTNGRIAFSARLLSGVISAQFMNSFSLSHLLRVYPFGTIKRWMHSYYFLCHGKLAAEAESSLSHLNYVSCSPFRVPAARLAGAQAVSIKANNSNLLALIDTGFDGTIAFLQSAWPFGHLGGA